MAAVALPQRNIGLPHVSGLGNFSPLMLAAASTRNITGLNTIPSPFARRAGLTGPIDQTSTHLYSHYVRGASFEEKTNSSRIQRVVIRAKRAMAEVETEAATQPKVEEPPSTSASERVEPPSTSTSAGVDLLLGGQYAANKLLPTIGMDVGKKGWREIQGQNNWQGLLDPIDLVLRSELIRYGEFANSAYDGFDNDQKSRFCGSCKYSKESLLEKVGLPNSGYEVTHDIFATAGEGVPKGFVKLIDRGAVGDENIDSVWSLGTNWIGYVAVSVDEQENKRLGRRDILVVWRGTVNGLEWTNNLQDKLDRLWPTGEDPRRKGQSESGNDLKVEQGFLSLYTASNPKSKYTTLSARRQALLAVEELVKKYGEEEELSITVTGHSLGSALATLCAYDIAETGCNQPTHLPDNIGKWSENEVREDPDDVVKWTTSKDVKTIPVTVFSFAGPRLGNNAFRDRIDQLGVKVLRVVNKNDLAPKVPGVFVNETSSWLEFLRKPVKDFIENLPWTYTHVGVPYVIDNSVSPFLKPTNKVSIVLFHYLEGSYLHVLTGFQGLNKPFLQVLYRDIALVNKAADFLLDKFLIPAKWYQQKDGGLVRVQEGGRWLTLPRAKDDIPEQDEKARQDAEDAVKILRNQ